MYASQHVERRINGRDFRGNFEGIVAELFLPLTLPACTSDFSLPFHPPPQTSPRSRCLTARPPLQQPIPPIPPTAIMSSLDKSLDGILAPTAPPAPSSADRRIEIMSAKPRGRGIRKRGRGVNIKGRRAVVAPRQPAAAAIPRAPAATNRPRAGDPSTLFEQGSKIILSNLVGRPVHSFRKPCMC